jgi:hypothetical protein
VTTKKHGNTANKFYGVGNEHHIAFGPGVSKGSNKGCKDYIGQYEEQFEQRRHPGRSTELDQEGNSRDQESIISKRRKKLRRHNDVKATVHSYNLVMIVIKA